MEERIRNTLASVQVPVYSALAQRYQPGNIIGKGSFGHVYFGTPTSATGKVIPELSVAGSVVRDSSY